MRVFLVRGFVLGFAAVALASFGAVVWFGNEEEPRGKLLRRADAFDRKPTPVNLQRFLECPADSSVGYLKMALTGRVFANHPVLFQRVATSRLSDEARLAVATLAELGEGVFEYYPEERPAHFGARLEAAGWLAGVLARK